MFALLAFFIVALAFAGLQFCYTISWNGLAAVPGPFAASVSNVWKLWALWRSKMHLYTRDAHKKYGPVVRIGPNTVSFTSSAAVHSIYSSRDAFLKVSCRNCFSLLFLNLKVVPIL